MKLAFLIIVYIFIFAVGATAFFFVMLWFTDKSFRRRPRQRWNKALDNIDKWLEEHSK